ncbi:flavoprotein NADH-dependent oxidoreductase [Cyathus striatus]|nr:flavoprotein NADH-dependent oxidoreductase [Cyathus striatus]
MSSTSVLFNPLTLGSITIPNRITMAALTRSRAPDSVPQTDVVKEYYVQRARGGAGLIVTEGALITRQGTEWTHAPGLWNSEQAAAWKEIVDAVHAEDTKIYIQVWHIGRLSHPDAPQQKLAGVPVYAPSAIAAKGGRFRELPGEPGYVTPTAVEDPQILIQLYKDSSVLAKEAGFDGVELHGANGYLITQFLDNNSNQRTDKWGGSIENRSRFGLEVIKAVKEVFGDDVAIKLSPAGGYNDVGMPLQDTIETYSYFIKEADKLGLSYIELMRYAKIFDTIVDGKGRATKHDIFETYAPLIKNAKFFANVGVTPEEGATLVSSGKADAIAIGFNWITHPDLAKRIKHGKPLNNHPDMPHLQWGKDEEDMRIGYTDYPEAIY